MAIIIRIKRRIPGVVATFCAPRVLYQVDAGSSKHDLKNATKLPKKKKKVDVVLVTSRKFVQSRSLLQEVV